MQKEQQKTTGMEKRLSRLISPNLYPSKTILDRWVNVLLSQSCYCRWKLH